MTVHSFRSQARGPNVQSEEEQAWVSFYRRARHNAAIAAEVLTQLDLDPEMKREHLALYLCCRESLLTERPADCPGQSVVADAFF